MRTVFLQTTLALLNANTKFHVAALEHRAAQELCTQKYKAVEKLQTELEAARKLFDEALVAEVKYWLPKEGNANANANA